MKSHSQRAQRVGDEIQRELAQLLRDEVKDPRVGRGHDHRASRCRADLSHAKVFFTHLAGRDEADEARARRCSAPPGSCAASSSHRLVALLGAAAALRLRRLDRVGHAAVAADRRRGRRRPQAAARDRDRAAPVRRAAPARRRRAAARQADRACRRTRRCSARSALLRAEKAGHTGTLDPLASGLLPLCFGEATKFAQSLLDARKAYVATVALRHGDDDRRRRRRGRARRAGRVRRRRPRGRAARLRRGRIAQVPPRYAALKFEGRAYYEYARAGSRDSARGARGRRSTRSSSSTARRRRCDAARRAAARERTCACSPRTSATALGSCAHLAALRRTASGPFRIGSRR